MLIKDGSPSGNHGMLVKHHPCSSYRLFRKTKVNPLYGVSAEMKLLLEMPEKVSIALCEVEQQ
jgi:hypothetical protein